MNNQLFPDSPDTLSQEAVIEVLKPHLEDIDGCVRDGWGEWMRFREREPEFCKPLDASCRASIVYRHIVASARRRFHDSTIVVLSEQGKSLRLVFYDKVVVKFKKLDDALYSSGIPTLQRLDYTRQICFKGFERTNLIVGYRLDESQTQIFDINVICPSDQRKNHWTYEVQSHLDTDTYLDEIPVSIEGTAKVSAKGAKTQEGNVG